MNYLQTLEYLYARLPVFHRIGPAALKPDLNNTLKFCKALGNPETRFKSIHIAGTNGKGSVSHIMASILQEAGYKTGLYTSPHLVDFRERIRVNGAMMEEDAVVQFVAQHQALIEDIEPSFFEVTVAMAFQYFADQGVDIAVIETGLGGRLDSTNVISPLLSIITNISYDHQYLLGNTLAEIAGEKAGIIKENTPVVIGKNDPETDEVFLAKATQMHAPLYFAGLNISDSDTVSEPGALKVRFTSPKDTYQVSSPLPGLYQLENLKTVLQSAEILNDTGIKLSKDDIISGIAKVKENTGLRGRWDVLQTKPLVIADVAHNEAGLRNVFAQIQTIPHKKLRIVYGMVKDKDIDKALSLLPKDAIYYFTQPALPRALAVNELHALATSTGLKGTRYPDVPSAKAQAVSDAQDDDIVLITGSIFVVAEVVG